MEDRTIRRAAMTMASLDPERTYEQHERYVRKVLEAVEERLVLRELYDAVVAELQRTRGVA